jgi:hypothetical protein
MLNYIVSLHRQQKNLHLIKPSRLISVMLLEWNKSSQETNKTKNWSCVNKLQKFGGILYYSVKVRKAVEDISI